MGAALGDPKWKNFTFRLLSVDDHAWVMEHLETQFLVDEPLNHAFGHDDDKVRYLALRVKIFLSQNLSFVAEDNETKEIGGLLLNIYHKVDHDLGIPPPSGTNVVRIFLNRIEAVHNIYEKFGVDQFAEIFIASVGRNYRGLGLAKEMFRRSLDLFKAHSYPVVKVCGSNPITLQICASLGFQELGSWKLSEAKDDDGEPLLPPNSNCVGIAVAITALKF